MAERTTEWRVDGEYHAAVDSVLDALSNHRRRTVVRELLAHPADAVDVETLGAIVAESETNAVGNGGAKRQNVAASLVHVHLPKLADARIVAYDHDAGTVQRRENALAEDILAVLDEESESDAATEP